MFAICLEASHKKGMGHLFRMLTFANYLKQEKQNFIFLINNNKKVKEILVSYTYKYEVVELEDTSTNWETDLITKYSFTYWINDRLDTKIEHIKNLKKNQLKVITFDDLGDAAQNYDLNICGLFFNNEKLKGKEILRGIEYLILNPEIDNSRKFRNKLNNILVTLGGSDTYGVTIKVLKLLKKYNIKATIHIGPSYMHIKELKKELTENFKVIKFIPSLIKEFIKYDLAITGGGITPFEANASGLPCIIIANETFEIKNGKFLEEKGASLFLGYHENIDESYFSNLQRLNIKQMSQNGLSILNTKATEKIYKKIIQL